MIQTKKIIGLAALAVLTACSKDDIQPVATSAEIADAESVMLVDHNVDLGSIDLVALDADGEKDLAGEPNRLRTLEFETPDEGKAAPKVKPTVADFTENNQVTGGMSIGNFQVANAATGQFYRDRSKTYLRVTIRPQTRGDGGAGIIQADAFNGRYTYKVEVSEKDGQYSIHTQTAWTNNQNWYHAKNVPHVSALILGGFAGKLDAWDNYRTYYVDKYWARKANIATTTKGVVYAHLGPNSLIQEVTPGKKTRREFPIMTSFMQLTTSEAANEVWYKEAKAKNSAIASTARSFGTGVGSFGVRGSLLSIRFENKTGKTIHIKKIEPDATTNRAFDYEGYFDLGDTKANPGEAVPFVAYYLSDKTPTVAPTSTTTASPYADLTYPIYGEQDSPETAIPFLSSASVTMATYTDDMKPNTNGYILQSGASSAGRFYFWGMPRTGHNTQPFRCRIHYTEDTATGTARKSKIVKVTPKASGFAEGTAYLVTVPIELGN